MKNLYSFLLLILLLNVVHAQYSFNNLNSQTVTKTVDRMATDNAGNSYVSGSFGTSITFGNTTLVNSAPVGGRNNTPQSAAYLTKLGSNGNAIWAKAVNLLNINARNGSAAYIHKIYVDAAGNVYITGEYEGKITLDNITLISNKNSYGDYFWDIFTAKLNSSGNFVWAKSEGTAEEVECQGGEYGWSVTADANGNAFVIGNIVAKVFNLNKNDAWPCGCGTKKLVMGIYLVKYSSSGTKLWDKIYYNSLESANSSCPWAPNGRDIACDGSNIYLTGNFVGTTIFGNLSLSSGSNTVYNSFFVKLDNNGNTVWANSATNTDNSAYNVLLDNNNNDIYFCGAFSNGTLNFGGPTLSTSSQISYLAKYTTSGTCLWAGLAGGQACPFRRMIKHPDGNIALPVHKLNTNSNLVFGFLELSPADGSVMNSNDPNDISNLNFSISDIASVDNGFRYVQNLQGSYTIGSTTITSSQPNGSSYKDLILVNYTMAPSALILSTQSDQHSNSKMEVYPNPASQQIMIISKDNQNLGSLRIYDSHGKLHYQTICENNQAEISLSNWPSGFYFITLPKSGQTQIFIKQ